MTTPPPDPHPVGNDEARPDPLSNGKSQQFPLNDPAHAKKFVASLFSGLRSPPPDTKNQVDPKHRHQIEKGSSPGSNSADTSTETSSRRSSLNFDQYIPQDAKELKETNLFQTAYRLIEWQRDNYLVGTDYANWRKEERQKRHTWFLPSRGVPEIPYDPTALGHGQIARIAADFIPSSTVQKAVLPLITPLPTGMLYPLAVSSLVSILQGQQSNLNTVMAQSLLTFLANPDNRLAMKTSTQGFLSTTYRNSD